MWFTLLVPILTSIFGKDGVIGTYIATKQQIQQSELSAKLELSKANVDLIKQQGIDAAQSESNKLAATSQNFKYVTFILINVPVIIVCCSPSRGRAIFENLMLIPVWYAQLYAAIYGIIWGLPVAANAMSSIFSAIQAAWGERQDKKIEKIQAINLPDVKLRVFDAIRESGTRIDQNLVDKINNI